MIILVKNLPQWGISPLNLSASSYQQYGFSLKFNDWRENLIRCTTKITAEIQLESPSGTQWHNVCCKSYSATTIFSHSVSALFTLWRTMVVAMPTMEFCSGRKTSGMVTIEGLVLLDLFVLISYTVKHLFLATLTKREVFLDFVLSQEYIPYN